MVYLNEQLGRRSLPIGSQSMFWGTGYSDEIEWEKHHDAVIIFVDSCLEIVVRDQFILHHKVVSHDISFLSCSYGRWFAIIAKKFDIKISRCTEIHFTAASQVYELNINKVVKDGSLFKVRFSFWILNWGVSLLIIHSEKKKFLDT